MRGQDQGGQERVGRIVGLSLMGLWLAVSALGALAVDADSTVAPANIAALERSGTGADVIAVSE